MYSPRYNKKLLSKIKWQLNELMEIIYKHKKKLSRTVILQLLSFPIFLLFFLSPFRISHWLFIKWTLTFKCIEFKWVIVCTYIGTVYYYIQPIVKEPRRIPEQWDQANRLIKLNWANENRANAPLYRGLHRVKPFTKYIRTYIHTILFI